MLNKRLVEAVGVNNEDKNIALTNLATEVDWYQAHKSNTSSAGSLEDLVTDSNKARDQYNKLTKKVIYKTLGQIALGKENYLRQKQITVIDELKSVLATIRQDNTLNTDLFDRSILDIANTINRSASKNSDAAALLVSIDKLTEPASTYDDMVFRISEGIAYLKNANTSLKEIIFRIKSN
jgi:hypothetical protein